MSMGVPVRVSAAIQSIQNKALQAANASDDLKLLARLVKPLPVWIVTEDMHCRLLSLIEMLMKSANEIFSSNSSSNNSNNNHLNKITLTDNCPAIASHSLCLFAPRTDSSR